VPARCVGGLVGVASRGVGGPDDELDDAADRAVAQRQHVEAEGQVTALCRVLRLEAESGLAFALGRAVFQRRRDAAVT